jgi:hypothetical protein
MRERHLERVERQVDVGAVLVAARRRVALNEADGVLGQRPAVFAGRVSRRGDRRRPRPFLDSVEDGAASVAGRNGLGADFDVVEVDEYCDVQTI